MSVHTHKIATEMLRDEGRFAYKNGALASAPRELSNADAYHWLCGYFEAEKSFQLELKHALSAQIDAINDLEGVKEALRVICTRFKLT